MSKKPIATIMRTEFPTLTADTPIRRAAAQLVDARAAAAPVLTEDGRVAGLITQKDCFHSALHASYYREWTGKVGDHMSRDVVTANVQDDLIKVAEMFLTYPHRVFPVLDGEQVVGVIHRSDILTELVRLG